MKEYLFSYGTLQKEKVQLQLFGRALGGDRDMLKGYKIAAIEIRDEVFLARGEEKIQKTLVVSNNPKDLVEGMAFEVTTQELLTADSYEPANYKRITVKLESGKQAWIYIADDE